MKTIFAFLIFLFIGFSTLGQHRIAGTIKNLKTGDPIAGVNLYLAGTAYSTASDKEGKYEITNISNGTYQLQVSCIGFQSEQVMLEIYQNKSSVHFRLQPDNINPEALAVSVTNDKRRIRQSAIQTQIISKEAIATSGHTNLPELLAHYDASFEAIKTNGNNSFINENQNERYSHFLIDGERISPNADGTIDLFPVILSGIERIEIIRGIGSSLYGNSAISNVVNIITRDVSKPIEVNTGIQASIYQDPANGNSRNDQYAFADINLKKGKFSSFTNGKFNYFSPYDLSDGNGIEGFRTQENEQDFSIRQKISFTPFDQLSISANANYSKLKNDFRLPETEDQKIEGLSCGIKTTYVPWEKVKFELSYHSNSKKLNNVINLGTEKKDSLDADNHFVNLRFTGNIQMGYFNHLSFGGELIRDEQSSGSNNFENKRLESYAVFLMDELTINKNINLLAGARNDFYSKFGSIFSPQVGLNFAPGKFIFRLGYGKGFRIPSFRELYAQHAMFSSDNFSPATIYINGNTDLKPEISQYLSGSVQFTSKKLDLTASYSLNQINKAIGYDTIPGVSYDYEIAPPLPLQISYQYYTQDEARLSSLQLQATYQPFSSITLSASGSYTDAINPLTNNDLPNMRKINARLNLDFKHSFGGYTAAANINVSYFGAKDVPIINNDKIELTEAPGYTMFRVMTTHTLKKHYSFKAGINNPFNKIDDHPEFYNLTSSGRMFLAGVSVSF